MVDTSAVLCRYLPAARRRFVGEAMDVHDRWIVSAMARTEVQLALHQAAGSSEGHRRLLDQLSSDWNLFWEVPLDRRCMARATEIGARYGLTAINAIHLAAADRLPGTVKYLTLDRRQIPAAADLGFQVVSPTDS